MVRDKTQIERILQRYFKGLHAADVQELREIFNEDCVLKAPGLRRTLAQWLAAVAERRVPATSGDGFDYRILHIDIIGEQAMAKVYCPLLGHEYIDFIGLLKENQNWCIVNKMYAERPAGFNVN